MSLESATITVNEIEYIVNELPSEIVRLIELHERWEAELKRLQEDVFKQQAAIRSIAAEIKIRIEQLPTKTR